MSWNRFDRSRMACGVFLSFGSMAPFQDLSVRSCSRGPFQDSTLLFRLITGTFLAPATFLGISLPRSCSTEPFHDSTLPLRLITGPFRTPFLGVKGSLSPILVPCCCCWVFLVYIGPFLVCWIGAAAFQARRCSGPFRVPSWGDRNPYEGSHSDSCLEQRENLEHDRYTNLCLSYIYIYIHIYDRQRKWRRKKISQKTLNTYFSQFRTKMLQSWQGQVRSTNVLFFLNFCMSINQNQPHVRNINLFTNHDKQTFENM